MTQTPENDAPVIVVELDRTSAMILNALRADLADEPPGANGNMPLPLQDEAAKAHAHWQDKVSAWRLLLGVRLVNAALDTRVIPPGVGRDSQ